MRCSLSGVESMAGESPEGPGPIAMERRRRVWGQVGLGPGGSGRRRSPGCSASASHGWRHRRSTSRRRDRVRRPPRNTAPPTPRRRRGVCGRGTPRRPLDRFRPGHSQELVGELGGKGDVAHQVDHPLDRSVDQRLDPGPRLAAQSDGVARPRSRRDGHVACARVMRLPRLLRVHGLPPMFVALVHTGSGHRWPRLASLPLGG